MFLPGKKIFQKIIFLIGLVFVVNGCLSPKEDTLKKFNVSKEEKIWLEKFFRYLMFHESSIYTLLGSKPLTQMHICYYKKSNEQLSKEEIEKHVYFLLNKNDAKDMEFYSKLPPDQKEKAILISDKDFIYDIDKLWDKWEKIQHRFPISNKFLLIKRTRSVPSSALEKIDDIMLVNIFQTSLVIQENYTLFKQAVGFDFDPLSVVFELENEHSVFWDKIRGKDAYNYCYLWGLLYGFGQKNTFGFLWKGRYLRNVNIPEKEKQFARNLMRYSHFEERPLTTESNAFSIIKFPIPAFVSYSKDDPIIAKYKKEREEIQDLYKGKDFVDFTLQLLTENKNTEVEDRIERLIRDSK